MAQEKAAETSIKVQTSNVVIDLIVTDRHGRHVPGLTAADFTVFEDGIPQKIIGFTPPSEWVGAPHALAGRDCVAHANIWLRKGERGLDVDYFFEAGDPDAGELQRVLLKDQQPAPKFAPGKSTVAGAVGTTPLQAADFAAYEMLKAHRLGENLPLYRY